MEVQGTREDSGTALTETEKQEVGAILSDRIERTMTADPLFESYGKDLGSLLWLWKTYGTAGRMGLFLAERFNQDRQAVVAFLKQFMGRAIALETGISHTIDFDRDAFNNIASIIDPVVILDALRMTFGATLDGITFEKCRALSGDDRLAGHFVLLFNKVQEERKAKAAAAREPLSGPVPAHKSP